MSINDILYLKEADFSASKFFVDRIEEIYSIRSELKSIAKKHFISIESYRKFVRKELNLKNKIPLYFSSNLLLFNIRSGKTLYWINYFNILKICFDDKAVVIFKNGDQLELETNKKILRSEIIKIKKILKYINML